MHGARLHGLTNEGIQVQSRVSRLSYGWCLNTNFVDGKHHWADKFWNDVEGQYMARGQMHWAILRVSLFSNGM